MKARLFFLFAAIFFLVFKALATTQLWKVQTSGIDTSLRAVSAYILPGEDGGESPVVWASGSNGVILESAGGGWTRFHVPEGEALDFRGIVAFQGGTTYLMSSGDGDKSRIYKTIDGGATWTLQYSDNRKDFFLDSIACVSQKECVALGDPIDGKFVVLKTSDGER